MTSTAKGGHLWFPSEWTYVSSDGFGPFTTRIEHRREDGSIHLWSSRRHRRGYGPEIVPTDETSPVRKRPSLVVWSPHQLAWWIAVLFMIGSAHFVVGSLLFLAGFSNAALNNMVFFIGSIFFTSAGYSQYYQSINSQTAITASPQDHKRRWFAWQPGRIDFWITFSQLLGTLMFNVNTIDAYLGLGWLGWLGQDLTIWVPDIIGSSLFQISGTLAVFEICHHWWCWRYRSLEWWSTIINFVGCVAFLISAVFAFVRPHPLIENLATYATIFTLIGAVCFFVGAYLLWPEMSLEDG